MKPRMEQAQFEALVARLLGILPQATKPKKVPRLACWLLQAEIGILIWRPADTEHRPQLIAATPMEMEEELSHTLHDLRKRFKVEIPDDDAWGYVNEEPVDHEIWGYTEAMIAFGTNRPAGQYELILLRRGPADTLFSSYHCRAARALLTHLDLEKTAAALQRKQENLNKCEADLNKREQDLKIERNEKLQYARSLRATVLRTERWDEFIYRLGLSIEPDQGNSDFLWSQGALWTAYRVCDEIAGKPRWTKSEAYDYLTTEENGVTERPEWRMLLRFLLDRDPALSKHLRQWLRSQVDHDKMPLAIALEHAWRKTLQAALAGGGERGAGQNGSYDSPDWFRKLLELTAALAASELGAEPEESIAEHYPSGDGPAGYEHVPHGSSAGDHSGAHHGDRSGEPPSPSGVGGEVLGDEGTNTNLDRDSLRLYFALLLARSRTLRRRYLQLGNYESRRDIPQEVRARFVRSLSRYMLSVVGIIQERLGIDCTPPAVSRAEILDSLLYLVDRYAHAELRVDERLNVREHLCRGLRSEVQHHFSKPFYRDHLIHVIDVFLLGHALLNTEMVWLEGKPARLVEHLERFGSGRPEADWLRDWAVTALLHDIGYQVGTSRSSSSDADEWEAYFDLPGFGLPAWLTAKKRTTSNGKREGRAFVEQLVDQFYELDTDNEWLPKKETYDSLDHGILSALRIAQILLHAESVGRPGPLFDDGQLVKEYDSALHAIAHHNLFDHEVTFSTHPLTCLLRLCDELQEWGRRRVNIERMVKNLYLNIEEDAILSSVTSESLASFATNLRIQVEKGNVNQPDGIKINLPTNPHFRFLLTYRSPVTANFDACLTFLNKAHNLQFLNLSTDAEANRELRFEIEMHFPHPPEYGSLTEYDIYALFAEQARHLPLLWHYDSMALAEAGLVRLKGSSAWDRIGVVVSGRASPGRRGWLSMDPDILFNDLKEFRAKLLASRRD